MLVFDTVAGLAEAALCKWCKLVGVALSMSLAGAC